MFSAPASAVHHFTTRTEHGLSGMALALLQQSAEGARTPLASRLKNERFPGFKVNLLSPQGGDDAMDFGGLLQFHHEFFFLIPRGSPGR